MVVQEATQTEPAALHMHAESPLQAPEVVYEAVHLVPQVPAVHAQAALDWHWVAVVTAPQTALHLCELESYEQSARAWQSAWAEMSWQAAAHAPLTHEQVTSLLQLSRSV